MGKNDEQISKVIRNKFFLFRWFCDFVELKNCQTNEIKCFTVHQWLDENPNKNSFSMTNYENIQCDQKKFGQFYKIRMKINETNLSSNNRVFTSMKLFGKSHQTEQISLNQTIDNLESFQRNNFIDTFEIRSNVKLNSIEKIEFYYYFQSNNGNFSLEWIEITNLSNGNLYCFPVNRILTSSMNQQQVLILNQPNNKICSSEN